MKALAPTLVSPPAVTPVSVDEAKANSRVETTDDDTLIGALIQAATTHVDGWSGILGRALITQSWAQGFSSFPAEKRVRLPLAPAESITSIQYYDTAGVQQTFASANYRLQGDALGPYVELVEGKSWPGTATRDDAVTITFVAGYGDAGPNVPQAIRQALLLIVSHFYENRELSAPITISEVPFAAISLLAPFRRRGL